MSTIVGAWPNEELRESRPVGGEGELGVGVHLADLDPHFVVQQQLLVPQLGDLRPAVGVGVVEPLHVPGEHGRPVPPVLVLEVDRERPAVEPEQGLGVQVQAGVEQLAEVVRPGVRALRGPAEVDRVRALEVDPAGLELGPEAEEPQQLQVGPLLGRGDAQFAGRLADQVLVGLGHGRVGRRLRRRLAGRPLVGRDGRLARGRPARPVGGGGRRRSPGDRNQADRLRDDRDSNQA